MEDSGFQFEREQNPHFQSRREKELKFIHPQLIKKLEDEGFKANAKKFYIKPLSDDPNCEIGFVTGKSSPLYKKPNFSKPNAIDTFDQTSAWTNRVNDYALDNLLKSIRDYLDTPIKLIKKSSNTFLFAWNPKKWDWTTLEQSIDQIEQTGRATEKWSVISHRKIQAGDRAFLMRLGEEPKGIMAAGFVATFPFLAKHWSGEDKMVHRVMIDFEVILNPEQEPLLSIDILKQGNLAKVNWIPQSSGIEINPEVTDELEAVWFNFLTTQKIRNNPFKETEKDNQKVYTEGTPNQVLVTKYERNPYARKTCIDHYGLSCSVCEFNFQDKYGKLGNDFIHVHHLKQVATIGKAYKINPINDLRPVCPNCHAMIHKRKDPYTIEEIQEIMKKASR